MIKGVMYIKILILSFFSCVISVSFLSGNIPEDCIEIKFECPKELITLSQDLQEIKENYISLRKPIDNIYAFNERNSCISLTLLLLEKVCEKITSIEKTYAIDLSALKTDIEKFRQFIRQDSQFLNTEVIAFLNRTRHDNPVDAYPF